MLLARFNPWQPQTRDHIPAPQSTRGGRSTASACAVVAFVLLAALTPGSGAAFGDTTANAGSSFSVDGRKRIIDIDGGAGHACLARSEGYIWCWGDNAKGQLGDNTTNDRMAPVAVKGPGGVGELTDAAALATGTQFGCVAKTDGTAWCWGDNADGQLGNNTKTQSSTPVQVKGPGGSGNLTGAIDVAAGGTFTCAVKTDGTVWCWGRNDRGQLGNNTTTDQLTPVQVKGPGGTGTLTAVADLGAGQKHTCAAKTDGTAWCWGDNAKGQLGDNTTTERPAPVQVNGPGGTGTLGAALSVGAGELFSCAALSDYTAWCWGDNAKGQLGDNTTTDRPAPVQVKGVGGTGTLNGIQTVALGDQTSCALGATGSLWCWGLNDKGQLGDNTTTNRSTPVAVVGTAGAGTISDATAATAGAAHACTIRADRSTWCWGDNGDGQLGDGTKNESPRPVQVL